MLITNVTGNFFLKENDTATEMHLAVQEVDGTPVDLSTASKVEVVIGTLEGRYLTKVPTILDAPGEFTFGLDEGDMLPTGDNLLEVHIFDETNSKRVAPSKGHYKLKVQRTIGALGLTVTTYTLDYFLSEVNRILFGLPQLLERGEALADRMDVLIEESEQGLDEMYTATDASRTATTQSIEATTAAELATQAAQQATVEADAATAETIQATSDADNATQASIAQTQAANDATSGANAATIRANTAAGEAEHQAFQAENAAQDANNATLAANTATDSADAASSRANTSAGRADTATANANNAADAANTAATEANTARDSANLAASLADGIATELIGYDNAIATFSLETKYLKHQLVRSGGSTYKAKVETQGNPLPVAPARSNEWFDLVAEKGEKGDMGTGINILGKAGSVAELPASGVPGDAYLIGENIHIWDGDGWLDGGPIQGPQGEIGPQGEVGVGLQYSWNGSQLGVKRADESTYTYRDLKGAKGDKGDNAKIITLDFVIPATDATQVDGNLINVHDYIYDAAADSIQFYLNSRILYPGEDFEMEGSTFRLLNWTGYDDPANVTFYIKVTRSVFNIDPEVSHATVVGALGYTPVDSATLTEHLLDRTLKHHVHHVAEVPTDLQNMGIMFKVDGSSSDVPGVTTNTDLMNRIVQAEQKFDTEISDVAQQLAQSDKKLTDLHINIRDFGAHAIEEKGFENFDSTIAIKAATAYSMVVKKPIFGSGTYLITDTIIITSASSFTLNGEGKRYMTKIKVADSVPVDTPLDAMFKFVGNLPLNIYTNEIALDANNRAMKILDFYNETSGRGTAYSQFVRTEFLGIRRDGYGIYGLSYVNKVTRCHFIGYGSASNDTTNWFGTGIYIANASNGVEITENDFARLQHAILAPNGVVTGNFDNNTYDAIKGAPIIVSGGSRSLSIKGGYFEACGGLNSAIDVYTGSPNLIDVNALIILSMHKQDYRAPIRTAVVTGNTFINCASKHVVALSGARGVVVESNNIDYRPEPDRQFDSFIHLFGHGTNFQNYGGNIIGLLSQNNTFETLPPSATSVISSVKKILTHNITGTSTDYKQRFGTQGVILKESYKLRKRVTPLKVNLIDKSIINHTDTTSQFAPYLMPSGNKVIKYTALNSFSPPRKVVTSDINPLKGEYVRVTAKVIQTASAPMFISVSDGIYTQSFRPESNGDLTTEDWGHLEGIFYVDESATSLSIYMQCSSGNSVYVDRLQITHISTDLNIYNPPSNEIEMTAPPTVGHWNKGEEIKNKNLTAGTYAKWICTVTGEPGTWKGFGMIEQ